MLITFSSNKFQNFSPQLSISVTSLGRRNETVQVHVLYTDFHQVRSEGGKNLEVTMTSDSE